MFVGSRYLEACLGWLKKAVSALCTRTGMCGLTLILFTLAITWFYWTLAYVKMDWIECWWFKERWRNVIVGLGTLAVFYFDRGEQSSIHWGFLTTFKVVILLTYLIVVLVNFAVISNPYIYFLSMGIGTLITTIIVLILGIKHKILDE